MRYVTDARLQEARYLRDRYKALRTQYVSDIKRLAFIADGNKKSSGIAHKVNCPFCGHDMEEAQSREPYVESAKAELTRIRLQLEDLQVTETDANNEIIMLENQLKELNVRNNSITQLINQRLRPKAQELRSMVAEYKRILQLRQELAAISYMSTTLAKLGKGENLTTAVLLKICSTLDCNISDIMDVVDDDQTDTH